MYRQGRIVYYCNTHEREGAPFGNVDYLRSLGLAGARSAMVWTSRGERLDEESSRSIVTAVNGP